MPSRAVVMKVPDDLALYLDMMIQDMEENRLEVCLVPSRDDSCAQDGGMIRAACGVNPKWYSDLCRMYPRAGTEHRKHPRTIIKRRNVLCTLRTMRDKGRTCSKYAEYLIKVAEEYRDLFDTPLKPFEDQF